MNNPVSSAGPVAALALTLPFIPRQTYPIVHPVAQVGLSRLNYYADPLGLLVLLGPYQGQIANETGRLYLNSFPQPLSTDISKDSTMPLEFRLPVGMLSNGVNTLKVSVQRQSGNEDSSELIVLHYLADPAAQDPDANPGNSLLNIDVAPKSIGQAEAAAGVIATMDYPGKQLYDILGVDVGSNVITHQIVPTAQDPNPETKPIVLTFKTADFAHAPNNPQFVFKYSVTNQTGDYSGTSVTGVFYPQKFWSKDCVVDVHLDRTELEEAIFQEILGENADDPKEVHLVKLNGGPLWAVIHLINKTWQSGDQIRLFFEAWLNGTVVATHEATSPINNVPGLLSWDIPNAKVIATSEVRVRYERIRAGTSDTPSKIATANVIGERITSQNFDAIPIGVYQVLVTPGLLIATISGQHLAVYAAPANEVPSLPGKIDGRALLLNPNYGQTGIYQFNLSEPTNRVSFFYSRILFPGGSVEFYKGTGMLIESKSLSVTGPYDSPVAHMISCDAMEIARFVVILPNHNGIVVDNFTF